VKRLMIRLPDQTHAARQARAQQAGEPLASTAFGLLRKVLEDSETATGKTCAPAHPVDIPPRTAGAGAPWVVSVDDPAWHQNTWGTIVALHERYPRALAKLEHDCYEHPERVETLAALAFWRANIDSSAEDPREELAFHNALQQLARVLNQTPGLGRPFMAGTTMPVAWGKRSV
jgi:hypothetical protein